MFTALIQCLNPAGFDIVNPAMQTNLVITQGNRYRRVGFDIVQLSNHVFTHHRVDFLVFITELLFSTTAFAASA